MVLKFRVHDVASGRGAQGLRIQVEQPGAEAGCPAALASAVTDGEGAACVRLTAGPVVAGGQVRCVAEVGSFFRAMGAVAEIEELSVLMRGGVDSGGELTLLLSPAGLSVAWAPAGPMDEWDGERGPVEDADERVARVGADSRRGGGR